MVSSRTARLAPRLRRRRDRTAGFTLMELMVVVAIIAIMAALAAPGAARALAISRAQRAIADVARVARLGRAASMAEGRAYALVFSSGATGRGRVELWRGFSNHCRTNDWPTIITTCSTSSDCVDGTDMTEYSTATHHEVVLAQPAGFTQACFQPDGSLRVRSSGTAPWGNAPNGVITFTLERREGGASVDPLRQALILDGAAPRLWR